MSNQVEFRSSQRIQGQRLNYAFTGTVDGDKMSGDVNLGEYGSARWTAERHHYKTPGGIVRPVKKA
jgi:L-seryl-tRNA(Ser) seleniumtransferase